MSAHTRLRGRSAPSTPLRLQRKTSGQSLEPRGCAAGRGGGEYEGDPQRKHRLPPPWGPSPTSVPIGGHSTRLFWVVGREVCWTLRNRALLGTGGPWEWEQSWWPEGAKSSLPTSWPASSWDKDEGGGGKKGRSARPPGSNYFQLCVSPRLPAGREHKTRRPQPWPSCPRSRLQPRITWPWLFKKK